MAKRPNISSLDAAKAGGPMHPTPRRTAIGTADVMVILSMILVSTAFGIGLFLQVGLSTVMAGGMAAALFALFGLVHSQKRRIDSLRPAEVAPVRREPELPEAETNNDATLEIASSQLAAAAAALREGEPAIPPSGREFGSRRKQRRGQPGGPSAAPAANEPAAHGWGEADAVDALVRQYARELDRSAEPPLRATTAPLPSLPVAAAAAAANAAPAEGPNAAAVRKAAEGDLEIYLQPIMTLADRKARLYEVFPRILNAEGKVLTSTDYLAEAEAMGLALAIERATIVRCCAIQRKLAERGPAARGMIVRLSTAAVRDGAFLQRLVDDINPQPPLADLILFEIDQAEIEQGGGVASDNMEFLGKAGFRFSLGSAETLALEIQELAVRRIAYVRVTPSVLSAEQNPTAVADLRQGGIETILTSIAREEDARVGRAFGLTLGQGPLFSEPKPLRPDVAASGAAAKRPGNTRAA